MDLSQLTESELQQLANVGNFSALGELANRRNTTTRSMESIEKENIRNAIARNLAADSQGTIKTFNMSQDNLKSNMLDNDNESQNDGAFIPEEETGVLSLRDILADLGRKGVEGFKDVAGRGIASQALGTAGGMILGPLGYLAGGIFGALKGGDMFDRSQSQINFNNLSPEAQAYTSSLYNPGGLLSGYNQISARGVGALGTLQNRLGNIQNTLNKQGANKSRVLQQREQQFQDAIYDIIADKDKKAGMNAPNNIGLGGGGGDSSSGDSDAGYSSGQSAGMGFGGGRSDPTDKS